LFAIQLSGSPKPFVVPGFGADPTTALGVGRAPLGVEGKGHPCSMGFMALSIAFGFLRGY